MTLEEAIRQLVNLGENDPRTIVEKLKKRHGKAWLTEQTAFLAEDIAEDIARHMIGRSRRDHEKVPPQVVGNPGLMGQTKWIPGGGYKRITDLTADDCRAIAAHYAMLEQSAGWRKTAYTEAADMVDAAGVATVGELGAPSLVAELEKAA